MEVPRELAINYLVDQSKKNINLFQRAEVVEALKNETGQSYRDLGKETGVSHVRLNEWANWAKVDIKEYEQLREQGLSNRVIFKMLFTDKQKTNYGIKGEPLSLDDSALETDNTNVQYSKKILHTTLDNDLAIANNILKVYIKEPKESDKTANLLQILRNTLNRIEMNIERKSNKKR